MKTPPHRMLLMFLVVALLPIASPAETDVAAQGWMLRDESDDAKSAYSLYARPRAGSDYDEYRMEVPLDAKPDDVLAAIEHNLLDPEALPPNFERVVLRREGSAMISHDKIDVPFLADRDVIMHTETGKDPASGHHVVRWHSLEDEGPPPEGGVVRMPSSRGSWTLTPHDGGTLAIYESHVELGGSLPASFVEAQMPKEIVQQAHELRRTMRERRVARR